MTMARIPSKKRLVSILQGEEDKEWEFDEQDMIVQFGMSEWSPTKITVIILFRFVHVKTGEIVELTGKDAGLVRLPMSQFEVRWY
jgi:hypothetical protein